MASKFKVIMSLAVVLALALGLSLGISKFSSQKKKEGAQRTEEASLPAATGNIDDLTAAIYQAANVEDQAAESDEDAFIISDEQAASDFDQTYSDNEI